MSKIKPVTLLLRAEAPLQSYGTACAGNGLRDTAAEPTNSAVVGILCSALGKPRREVAGDGFPTLREFSSMRMAVRADKEGVLVGDFQTAGAMGRLPRSDGSTCGDLHISTREYLSDASFLVAFEGDPDLLRRLDKALGEPVWAPCLGRKSCPPGIPIRMPGGGIREMPLIEAIERESAPDWLPRLARRRFVVTDNSSPDVRHDVPMDFAARRFGSRRVRTYWK